jgi:hypothetical protein
MIYTLDTKTLVYEVCTAYIKPLILLFIQQTVAYFSYVISTNSAGILYVDASL